MDAPTFEWRNNLVGEGERCLVASVGENYVAFRIDAHQEDNLKYAEMAAWSLWAKEHEHDEWIPKPLDSDNLPPDEELLAIFELSDAYESDRAAYVEEAQEAYREFANLTT